MATTQSSGTGIDALPVEILRQIVGLLTRKELKVLRLQSRKLCSVASEQMFERITVSTTDASFIQLANVASDERWRGQVRHVDWILLNAYGTNPGTSQTIVFKNKGSLGDSLMNTRPSRLPTGDDISYVGLDLQCQIMRLITPQTVRFRCGLKCHRVGREPWQDQVVRSDKVESSRFETVRFGWGTVSTNVRRGPITVSADDIFSVLREAGLSPCVLETPTVIMHLEYSVKGEIEHVNLISIKEGPVWKHRILSGTNEAELEYKEWLSEMRFFSSTMNCSFSFARNIESNVLKSLKVSGVPTYVEDLGNILLASRGLRELHLRALELSVHEPDIQPIPEFLFCLRDLWRKRINRTLRVELEDLTTDGFRGTFSATEHEVAEWMQHDRDDLLDALQVALTAVREPWSGGEDGRAYELGARFRYEADFAKEDDYEYDTEEETIQMMCRQSIKDYCDYLDA